MTRLLLATYEYSPDRGGVARYLGGLFGELPAGSTRVLKFRMPRLPLGWLWHLPKLFFAARAADLIVVSHLLPLGTAAMLSGKPYAAIVHGLDLRSAAKVPRKKALAARVLRGARFIVANSHATASELPAFGLDPASALVLTPGVTEAHGYERKTSGKRVLAVGRLVRRKGFDRLIDLMPRLRARHPEAMLTIAGAGPEEGRLRALAAKTGASVDFAVAPDDAEIGRLYAESNVFALPVRTSTDDVEGFGMVYLEAAMRGLPSVGTRIGGVPEAVVDGETGLLVPPEDDEALFLALDRLLSDPALAARLGANGRARAIRDFRWTDRARLFMQRLA